MGLEVTELLKTSRSGPPRVITRGQHHSLNQDFFRCPPPLPSRA
jgi:hypothetical protein